jgi:hypothetical protein
VTDLLPVDQVLAFNKIIGIVSLANTGIRIKSFIKAYWAHVVPIYLSRTNKNTPKINVKIILF